MHEGHKDTVQHFGNLEKGIAGFAELKDILQQDPSKIADPAVRAQAEALVRTALSGAKKDINKVFADVIETIGTVLVLVEFVLIMGPVRVCFVVAGQASVVHESSQGPLDGPAAGQNGKSPGGGVAADDVHVDVEGGGVLDEVLAVAAVDPGFADGGMLCGDCSMSVRPAVESCTLAAATSTPRRSPTVSMTMLRLRPTWRQPEHGRYLWTASGVWLCR